MKCKHCFHCYQEETTKLGCKIGSSNFEKYVKCCKCGNMQEWYWLIHGHLAIEVKK